MYDHPLYQGMTGHMFGEHSLPILQKADVTLVCGTYIVPEVFPHLGDVFAAGSKVVHVDLNAYEIAKNHPVDIGVVADPKLTLPSWPTRSRRRTSPATCPEAQRQREQARSRRTRGEAADPAHATPIRCRVSSRSSPRCRRTIISTKR
jgi:benzoylformate decarboxylase